MTPRAMEQEILDHWEKNYPKTFRAQDKTWLTRQAVARAQMCQAEMKPLLITMSQGEAWSEVAKTMLTR